MKSNKTERRKQVNRAPKHTISFKTVRIYQTSGFKVYPFIVGDSRRDIVNFTNACNNVDANFKTHTDFLNRPWNTKTCSQRMLDD